MALNSTLRKMFEPYSLMIQSLVPNILTTSRTRMNLPAKLEPMTFFAWDRLPDDLLEMIFRKLWTGDRVRLRLVCKSWNRILIQSHFPTALEAPWKILSDDSYKNPQSYLTEVCFRSLSENRIYRFKLPMLDGKLDKGLLCAHSRGWLVLTTGPNSDADLYLWNPLNGAARKLPPLSTLPFYNDFKGNLARVIQRVEVFSFGSVDCVVAALFVTPEGRRIALCTPRELKWTPFIVEQEDEEVINLVDILFHTVEEKLNFLATDRFTTNLAANNFKSKKFVITLMDCQVEMVPHLVPDETLYTSDQPGFKIYSTPWTSWHLVESSITPSVLNVAVKKDVFESRNDDEGPIPDFWCEQTTQVIVHELDGKREADFKKEAIFVGATGSFSIPVIPGIVPSCVYFEIDDSRVILGFHQGELYINRESGQYFITGDKKVMRRNPFRIIGYSSSMSKIGWFMPHLFIC